LRRLGGGSGAAGLLTLAALTLPGSAGADLVYRIQAGDSLYSLAKKSGTTVQNLQRLNGLNGVLLRPGQAIKLPGGGTPVVRNASGNAAPGEAPALRQAAVPRAAVAPTAVAPTAVAQPVVAQAAAPTVYQRGMAVYYGGRRDARTVLTAAHLTLPLGTWVEVTHARTGRSVLVLINDRGPFGQSERVIDLSSAAARALGIIGEGVAPVTLRIAREP
jgi:rare lipoprotein A